MESSRTYRFSIEFLRNFYPNNSPFWKQSHSLFPCLSLLPSIANKQNPKQRLLLNILLELQCNHHLHCYYLHLKLKLKLRFRTFSLNLRSSVYTNINTTTTMTANLMMIMMKRWRSRSFIGLVSVYLCLRLLCTIFVANEWVMTVVWSDICT